MLLKSSSWRRTAQNLPAPPKPHYLQTKVHDNFLSFLSFLPPNILHTTPYPHLSGTNSTYKATMATHEQLDSTSSRPPLDPTTYEAEHSSEKPLQPILHIGTRKSALAVIQAELVKSTLESLHPDATYEIHAMSTMGDKRPLYMNSAQSHSGHMNLRVNYSMED
jgi:hypothetical protein